MSKTKIVVGIDPGASCTGVCAYDPAQDNLLYMKTLNEFSVTPALGYLRQIYDILAVGVELSTNTHLHRRWGVGIRGHFKIAQDVGSNKRLAASLIRWLGANGYKVYKIEPRFTKIAGENFERMFPNYRGRSSSHSRDAAMVALRLWGAIEKERMMQEAADKFKRETGL